MLLATLNFFDSHGSTCQLPLPALTEQRGRREATLQATHT